MSVRDKLYKAGKILCWFNAFKKSVKTGSAKPIAKRIGRQQYGKVTAKWRSKVMND